MSKTLSIGKTESGKAFTLPEDAVTQTFSFLARKGAGKTYGASKLCEELLEAHAQVVVIDPVGKWYGLRMSADGKPNGYSVPVLGGAHGDIPLEPTAGALVAETIIGQRASMILDVSAMRKGDRKRFATDFAEAFYHGQKNSDETPVHLFIEEAQVFVPQRIGKEEARMAGAFEDIVRLGRNCGIGVTLISQRPQSTNKEVLNQTEVLFVLQTNGTQERKAISEWIVHQGLDKNLANELPGLPIGTAYVWSPSWLRFVGKVQIGKKRTFDASATPKLGRKRKEAARLSRVDLRTLQKAMADSIEQAQANDPKKLRSRIRELEKQLATEGAIKQADPQQIEVAVQRAVEKRDREWTRKLSNLRTLVERACNGLDALRAFDFGGEIPKTSPVTTAEPVTQSRTPRPAAVRANGAGMNSSGESRILLALAQHPDGLAAPQIGIFADLSARSGTFGTYIGRLRSRGLIEGDRSRFRITSAGLAEVGDFEPLPTGPDLIDHWRARLGGGGKRRIFDALIEAYPRALSKDEIGEATGLSPASGTFGTYLGTLRTMQLAVKVDDGYAAAEELFD